MTKDKAGAYSKRAVSLLNAGRNKWALRACEKSLALDPKRAATWQLRCAIMCNLERYQEALEGADKALALEPQLADVWWVRGYALLKLERYQEGLESTDKALAMDPKCAVAWWIQGAVLSLLGQYEDAIGSFDKALGINPELPELAWLCRAGALKQLGRHEDAIGSFDRALRINPENPEAWLSRALALKELGRHEDAIGSFDKALKISPELARAWLGRALALGELGRHEEVLVSIDKALAIDPNSAIAWVFRGITLKQLGRHEDAIGSFDKALGIDPDLEIPPVLRLRGSTLGGTEHRTQEAVELLAEELRRNPEQTISLKIKTIDLDLIHELVQVHRPPDPLEETQKHVTFCEERMHIFVRQKLMSALGHDETEWWVKGIPQQIRLKCAARREEDPERLPLYNYIDLIDLKEIMDKGWRLFNADFQRVRVKEQVKSKNEFLSNLVRLNKIRNSVMHPVRGSFKQDDYTFARQMKAMIQAFALLNR